MADGNITVEVSTQAAQAELERLRAENARLAREAHTWWTALAGATAEIERLRADAERYRWLSEQATQQADANGPIFRISVRRSEDRTLFSLSAAIDAAIKETP